ncbi:hypothetical protein R1sor_004526 [Riccia sorocarpa]|uniref:Uncharacterized protein n=1 Tax=Riccia sorocarpa TaxID=122646 RepID=A0ABD3HLA1_9MARC
MTKQRSNLEKREDEYSGERTKTLNRRKNLKGSPTPGQEPNGNEESLNSTRGGGKEDGNGPHARLEGFLDEERSTECNLIEVETKKWSLTIDLRAKTRAMGRRFAGQGRSFPYHKLKTPELWAFEPRIRAMHLTFLLWEWTTCTPLLRNDILDGKTESGNLRNDPASWTKEHWRTVLGDCAGSPDGPTLDTQYMLTKAQRERITRRFGGERHRTNGFMVQNILDPFRRLIVLSVMSLFYPHRTTYLSYNQAYFFELLFKGKQRPNWARMFHRCLLDAVTKTKTEEGGTHYWTPMLSHLVAGLGLLHAPLEQDWLSHFPKPWKFDKDATFARRKQDFLAKMEKYEATGETDLKDIKLSPPLKRKATRPTGESSAPKRAKIVEDQARRDLTQDSDEEEEMAEVLEQGTDDNADQTEEEDEGTTTEEVHPVDDAEPHQDAQGEEVQPTQEAEAREVTGQQGDEVPTQQEDEVKLATEEATEAVEDPSIRTEERRRKKKKLKKIVLNEREVAPSTPHQHTAEAGPSTVETVQAESQVVNGLLTVEAVLEDLVPMLQFANEIGPKAMPAEDWAKPGRLVNLLKRLRTDNVHLIKQKMQWKREVSSLKAQLATRPTETQKAEVVEEVQSYWTAKIDEERIDYVQNRLSEEKRKVAAQLGIVKDLREQLDFEKKTTEELSEERERTSTKTIEYLERLEDLTKSEKTLKEELRDLKNDIRQAQNDVKWAKTQMNKYQGDLQIAIDNAEANKRMMQGQLDKAKEDMELLKKKTEENEALRLTKFNEVIGELSLLAQKESVGALNDVKLEELRRIEGYLREEKGRMESDEVLNEHYDSFISHISEAKTECLEALVGFSQQVEQLRVRVFPVAWE